MSTEAEEIPEGTGFPELTQLGKRIELLRIERGLSKQRLARAAGTSRQQLWRVMTGKSELTSALCERLADVLQADSRTLRNGGPIANGNGAGQHSPDIGASPADLTSYVSDPALLRRTLATLPNDAGGRRLKRELMNCVEDIARESEVRLPGSFFELRGRVINDEL